MLGAAVALAGCGATQTGPSPVPAGVGMSPRYRPPPSGAAVRAAAPVGGLRCSRARVRRFGVHVELLAHGRIILLPAGVGLAPPLRRCGAYVAGGRCSYPIRTLAPTGVLEVQRSARWTLGDLFALWGSRSPAAASEASSPRPTVGSRPSSTPGDGAVSRARSPCAATPRSTSRSAAPHLPTPPTAFPPGSESAL